MKIENAWDAWGIEWENAKRFFNSKGNIHTRSKLKDKWHKEFMEILKFFYEQGKFAKENEGVKS